MAILEVITGNRIYLDTNIFIYAVEGYAKFETELNELFEALDAGNLQAITSELTLAEVLVKPLIDKNAKVCSAYENAIQSSQVLEVVPINRTILRESALLRSTINIRLPDAIHAATAILNGCKTFLTNDKRLEALSDIDVVVLSNLFSP